MRRNNTSSSQEYEHQRNSLDPKRIRSFERDYEVKSSHNIFVHNADYSDSDRVLRDASLEAYVHNEEDRLGLG